MKKNLLLSLMALSTLTLASCGSTNVSSSTTSSPVTESSKPAESSKPEESSSVESSSVDSSSTATEVTLMTYAEFVKANKDDEVLVETYIQDKQSWWTDKNTGVSQASFYCESEDGAYFLYNMPCSEEEYKKLTPGTKVRVKGIKAEWAGEVEISEATFEILEGNYIAPAKDVTKIIGETEKVNAYINQKVNVYSAEVVASKDKNGAEHPFLYKWDGSGDPNQNCDLYFNVKLGNTVQTLTVESYLCPEGSETYTNVTNLKVGDVIDLTAFLYWYNGPQPHVTKVTQSNKSAGVDTHAQYLAADKDDAVIVETYVQAKQSWWTDSTTGVSQASFYTEDEVGGYFLYNLPCSKEEYGALVPGTKIRVTGTKSIWAGEDEIIDARYEIIPGSYIPKARDISLIYNDDEVTKYANTLVSVKSAKVVASKDKNGVEHPFLYKYDGSGEAGKNHDVYFNVEINGVVNTVTVESYLCQEGSDVYTAATNLKVGDLINFEAYLYQYNGNQPHVTSITSAIKGEGIANHTDFINAEKDTELTIETYIQAKQSWWTDSNTGVSQASFYTQDEDGAYFLYNVPCSKEQYEALVPGTKIRAKGTKSVWAGEDELTDVTFEVISGNYVATPMDITSIINNKECATYANALVTCKSVKVVASTDKNGEEHPFLYKWDGSGEAGKNHDLYFNVEINGVVNTVTVESYLCAEGSDVYTAVTNLKVGQYIDFEAFLYQYNGNQPHVTSITLK